MTWSRYDVMTISIYFFNPQQPHEEHDAVEEVFEQVVVEHVEPLGVELDQQRDEEKVKERQHRMVLSFLNS